MGGGIKAVADPAIGVGGTNNLAPSWTDILNYT